MKPVQLIAHDRIDCEVRFNAPGEGGEIEGVAVRFNTVDSYRTEFAPSAFAVTGRAIPMLWSHDTSQVIGSWSSLQVRADGLAAKGKLNLSVAKALEVRSLLLAGDISGLSVGFATIKDERLANGVRRILEARLHEISIVALPSVPGSHVANVRAVPNIAAFTASIRAATASLKGN